MVYSFLNSNLSEKNLVYSEFVQKRRVSHLPSSEEDGSEGEAEADEQSSQLMSDQIVKEVMGD